jgi:hypothetical protein
MYKNEMRKDKTIYSRNPSQFNLAVLLNCTRIEREIAIDNTIA